MPNNNWLTDLALPFLTGIAFGIAAHYAWQILRELAKRK